MKNRRLFAIVFLFVFVFAFAFTFTAQESTASSPCCKYESFYGWNYGTWFNGECNCAVPNPYHCFMFCVDIP